MRRSFTALALTIALALPAFAYKLPSSGTAWLTAAADADIERAFAQARSEHKPVLLYWGAEWCPPCNQLKATLFNRQDFIERSKSFVAVHVDGDLPGAQRLGSRFKVRGYPTVILFNAEGQELTRLPGEVDAPQVMAVLQLGLASGRPIKTVLADARAGKRLAGNEWRLLSYYSWDTDEQQLVPEKDRPALLASLAGAAPDADIAARLWLKALAAGEEGQGIKADAALRDRVRRLLADPQAARAQMDVLVNGAPQIVRGLDAGRERAALLAAFDTALKRLQSDTTLSRADRESALIARVDLARLDQPKDAVAVKLPPALLKEVRSHVARDDREITDGYERQAVITSAGYLLGRAGLWAESDQLLERNLAKSHSPYYLMSQLAGNARKRGDKAGALRWYEQAFDKSEGPATRLQWGASYLSALVELSPQDAPRIEKAASRLFAEAGQDKGAFHERSGRSLQRVGSKLAQWNAGGAHAASMQRLRTQLDGVCAKVDAAEKAACEGLLKPGGA
jgi:thioredoxin-like negative regulator of GroEL